MKKKKSPKAVLSPEIRPDQKIKEIAAAKVLLSFFKKDILVLPEFNIKSPDYLIGGQYWELKSPTGNGKHNLQHQLQDADDQSKYIIIDARKSKLSPAKIEAGLKYQLGIIKGIKRLILIKKDGAVTELFR